MRGDAQREPTDGENACAMPSGASAYLAFANANRNDVKEELLRDLGEGAKVGIAQLGKELGKRWKLLSDEEKARYKEEALKQLREREAKRAIEGGDKGDGDAENAPAAAAPQRQALPTALVKRLILSDPDLKRVSGPALSMLISSTEAFLGLLTEKARDVAVSTKRRTIRYSDLQTAAKEGGWRFAPYVEHLNDVEHLIMQAAPAGKVEGGPKAEDANQAQADDEDGDGAAATPVKRITDFFSNK